MSGHLVFDGFIGRLSQGLARSSRGSSWRLGFAVFHALEDAAIVQLAEVHGPFAGVCALVVSDPDVAREQEFHRALCEFDSSQPDQPSTPNADRAQFCFT